MDGKIRCGSSSDVFKALKVVKLERIIEFRLGEPPEAPNMNWTKQQRSGLLFVVSKVIRKTAEFATVLNFCQIVSAFCEGCCVGG